MNGHVLERMQTEAAALVRENANLRAGNARLRSLHRVPAWHDIVHQAERDALAMLELRYGGVEPKRSQCHKLGMSYRRWQWAVALLRLSGVYGVTKRTVKRRRTYVRYDVRDDLSLGVAQGMVSARVLRLLARPDGLEVLRQYNGRYGVGAGQ